MEYLSGNYLAPYIPPDLSGARVLLLGGTRYFGKRLVSLLLDAGAQVTIATRGLTIDRFAGRVERVRIDRTDRRSMRRTFEGKRWDLVYDQLCYAPSDAADLCDVLDGTIGRYVMTSSQMVYGSGVSLRETDFDAASLPIRSGRRSDFTYAEGKRLAEAVIASQRSFSELRLRLPVVLAEDDYTDRLGDLVRRIAGGAPVPVGSLDARISLISADEAAALLLRCAVLDAEGALNGASAGTIGIGELIEAIEERTGRRATLVEEDGSDQFGLTVPRRSLTLNTEMAATLGVDFEEISAWLPSLLEGTVERIRREER